MSWQDLYRQKLVSVTEAAGVVKSGDRIWAASIASIPIDLINALCRRREELIGVQLFSGLLLTLFDYYKAEFKGHIDYTAVFKGPIDRQMDHEGNVDVISYQFSQTDWLTENIIKPNVFMAEVSLPDENGNMSYGPAGTFNNHVNARFAKTRIVQMNRKVPYVYGNEGAFINIRDIDYICEADHDLPELPEIPITDIDRRVADQILPYIEDGSTIQIGVGSLGNAIGYSLIHHKNLGVHTELMCDSLVTLIDQGVITGSEKTLHPDEVTCSFVFGSKKLYDLMDHNEKIKTYPISYIANENVIAQNNKMVCINNALMCDLTGQMCSESVGFRQFSCTGGQLSFIRGSRMSPGGKAFLALESTAQKADGSVVSRITTALPPGAVITTPRTDVDYIVTEWGVAHVRGKSIKNRVKEIVSIAHPDFREQLMREATEVRLI